MHPVLLELINNTQYGFHCAIVLVVLSCAFLVYVFGFRSAVEPPFDKLSYPGPDKSSQGGQPKKKKSKEKKAQSNGHVTAVGGDTKKSVSEQKSSSNKKEEKSEKSSPSKDAAGGGQKNEKKSPAKNALRETKGSNKDVKKSGSAGGDASRPAAAHHGKGKENVEQVKNKKNHVEEKPKDFDDGEWEQALSRKDKKNRKATLDEIIAKDKKKDGKKKNKGGDDSGLVDPSGDLDVRMSDEKEKSQVLEALAEIGLSTSEVETGTSGSGGTAAPAAGEAAKPKKTKKKKPADQQQQQQQQVQAPPPPPPVTEEKVQLQDKPEPKKAVEEQTEEPAVVEPTPPSDPKPQRTSKKQDSAPGSGSKAEETVVSEPIPVSSAAQPDPAPVNIAFDELGDAWKEAKVPKKATKKKSRKD